MDVNKTGSHLVVGYDNGTIILLELTKFEKLKIASNHSSAVLSVKFLKGPKLSIVSSDEAGEVLYTEFSKSMFGYNANSQLVYRSKLSYAICPLFPNTLHPNPSDNYSIVAIGTADEIIVAMVEPQIKIIFNMKHRQIAKKPLPYIDWGRGAIPGNSENDNIVLAIAYDKVVQLVEIKDLLQKEEGYVLNGYYDGEIDITGIAWLSEGVIIIMTSSRELKLLYSGSFTPGKYQESDKKKIYQKHKEELEVSHDIGEEVQCSPLRIGKKGRSDSIDPSDRVSYHQTLISKGCKVMVLCKNSLLSGKLYSWNDYIEAQGKNNQWWIALGVSLQLFSGKIKGFAELPEQKELKEASLRAFLKNFLREYVLHSFEGENKEAKQASIAIEFCIGISTVDYLFEDMQKLFIGAKQEVAYIEALEPFILEGKFKADEVPQDLIKLIINHYTKKNEIDKLEIILLKFNLQGHDIAYLTEICIKNKMMFALIYIKTLTDDYKSYVEPIAAMHAAMNGRPSGAGYTLDKLSLPSIGKQVELSSNFLGYSVMWYIDMCFKRIKFPKRYKEEDNQISLETWPKIVFSIIDWLLNEKDKLSHLKDLMKIDLGCLLNVIQQLYENQELRNMILDPSKYSIPNIILKGSSEIIAAFGRAVEEAFPADDLRKAAFAKFIAKVSAQPGVTISGDMCIYTADKMSLATKELAGGETDRKEYEQLILGMLKNCKLNEGEMDKLITMFSSRAFTEVLIFLREVRGLYIKCFETYLASRDQQSSQKIFPWLQRIHEKIGDDETLKAAIYDKLEVLVNISLVI